MTSSRDSQLSGQQQPETTEMQIVGHHLQIECLKHAGKERDLFARSAFNRYYYCSYLLTRNMLNEMDSSWPKTGHKNFPELLKGTIASNFKRERNKASKNEDYNLYKILNAGINATSALSNIITKAYATRVIADYYQSIDVNFEQSDRFSLNNIDISDAHGWEEQVKAFTDTILNAWKQINA